MTKEESLQSASAEARKAAAARACVEILDEYATSLSDPACMGRAFDLRRMLHDQLAEITLAVHASDKWRLGI